MNVPTLVNEKRELSSTDMGKAKVLNEFALTKEHMYVLVFYA